jgi:Na+/proline symporter
MQAVSDRALAILLTFFTASCLAQTVDESAASAPEPTVSAVWVIVFLAIFVAICAWIGIAIWRSERKNRASSQQNVRS